jgi:carbonic anhydrase
MAKMQKLIDGHKRFLSEVFPAKKSHFHLLSESQAPAWLFITCADSRVVPDLILGTEPGDLFIARSIGNVVPNPSRDKTSPGVSGPEVAGPDAAPQNVDGVTATIEYSVEVLKVRHAIVCGHSDCGAMKAALDRKSLVNLPKARRWLDHVQAAFAHRQPLNPADGETAELASLIRGNVVAQLMNLHAQPPVAHAEAEGRLTVHGWYYDILTGQIEEYDEKLKKFVPLA